MLGQLDSHMQKHEFGPLPITSYIKINSKEFKDLNVRAKVVKLLKGNINVNLHDRDLGHSFLARTPDSISKEKNCTSSKYKMFVCQRTPSRK